MKKISAIILTILTLAIAMTGCFKNVSNAKAIITIKSEAIVELVIDERERVVSIAPLNSAAEVAVIDLDIINDTVSVATRKLVSRLSNLGYINAVNKNIYVDTLTLDNKKMQMFNRAIFNTVKSYDKTINIYSYDFKIEERDHRSFVRNTKGYENLDLLQYRMITNLKRYRSDITYKLGARMSIEELTQQLIERYEFSAQFHTFELTKWFTNDISAKKKAYGQEIADILGGVYAQYYKSFVDLSSVMQDIIDSKTKEELTFDKIKAVLNIIGINNDVNLNYAYETMSKNALGYPTINSLEEYIDNIYINKVFANDSLRENFERQIDQAKMHYKLNSIQLTEEEKNKIVATLPVNISYQYSSTLNNLEDVYYILKIIADKLKSDYSQQYNASTQDLKIKIDAIINRINSSMQDSIMEHKQLIDKEFERLSKENKARLEIYKK